MKTRLSTVKTFIPLLSILYPTIMAGQLTQKGLVREMNSNKSPISGVSVSFYSAASTESDIEGKFTLQFSRVKKNGDVITPESVKKAGFEVVNEKELNVLRFSSDGMLAADIIMVKSGVIQAAKLAYVGASSAALKNGFEREKSILKKRLQASQINENRYRTELLELQENLDRQQNQLDELANTFARTNFDDVNPAYKRSLEFFKQGFIDKAIAELESVDLIKQAKDILNEEKRLTDLKERLKEDELALANRKRLHLDMMVSLADMYSLKLKPESAEEVAREILAIDENDLEILQRTAELYEKQHQYQQAIQLYEKIIQHPETNEWEKANAFANLGNLKMEIGQLDIAEKYFLLNKKIYEELEKINNQPFFRNNLAVAYQSLGKLYQKLGDVDKAENYITNFFKIQQSLFKNYPNNSSYTYGLIIAHHWLGDVLIDRGNLSYALKNYDKALELSEDINKNDFLNYKKNLAISHQKVGKVLEEMGDFNKALFHYTQFNTIEEELLTKFPNDIQINYNLALSNQRLGIIFYRLELFNRSLKEYHEFGKLILKLSEDYPENIKFKNALGIYYQRIAQTYMALGEYEKAENAYKSDLKIAKDLLQISPKDALLKNGLASSYNTSANFYSLVGDFQKSLDYYIKFNQLALELSTDYPQNADFKYTLTVSYQWLGNTYTTLRDFDKALSNFLKDLEISRELYELDKSNTSRLFDIAIAHQNLGRVYFEMNNFRKALPYFKEQESRFKELTGLLPTNQEFKKGLTLAYQNLGRTYKSLGQTQLAHNNFLEFNRTASELLKKSPENIDYRGIVSYSYQFLGHTYSEMGEFNAALSYYFKYKSSIEQLISEYPENVNFRFSLAGANSHLGHLYQNRDKNKARAYLRAAIKIYDELLLVSPSNNTFQAAKSYVTTVLLGI